jgi:phosphate-selective porin OprO and OprP
VKIRNLWKIRGVIDLMTLLVSLACLSSAFAAEKETQDTIGSYIYWDEGISLTGPAHHFDLKVSGKINYDFGNIDADDELQAAFPDFNGFHNDFRRLNVSLFGSAWDILEFKLAVDFANLKDIKDQWFRVTKGRFLPHFTFGYMKEPFSLEMLTGSNYLVFMEDTLATKSFSPFRNFGITAAGSWQEKRMTWATGFFLNTGSYSDVGDSQDQISDANGFDLSGRITGLPVYRDDGKELVHLGFSFLHGFRNDAEDDPSAQARTRPESRLTDDRLVDTSIFRTQGRNLIDLEAAWVKGPLSIQGEYFHNFVDSPTSVDLNGWYVQGSWMLTGETRKYRTAAGVFAGINPERELHLGKSGWGALELALRLSRVDLNDKFIEGGKERNFTAGLNWYLRRKIRFMVNYVHVKVEDRAAPDIDNGRADIIMTRFQVNF